MYIIGDYVIARVFGLPPAQSATIIGAEGHSTAAIRQQFRLSDEVSLDLAAQPAERPLNADFWRLLPGESTPSTVDATQPISRTLCKVAPKLTDEDNIRFLSLAMRYPWTATMPAIHTIINEAQAFHENDRALAELYSLKHAERHFAALIRAAAERSRIVVP